MFRIGTEMRWTPSAIQRAWEEGGELWSQIEPQLLNRGWVITENGPRLHSKEGAE